MIPKRKIEAIVNGVVKNDYSGWCRHEDDEGTLMAYMEMADGVILVAELGEDGPNFIVEAGDPDDISIQMYPLSMYSSENWLGFIGAGCGMVIALDGNGIDDIIEGYEPTYGRENDVYRGYIVPESDDYELSDGEFELDIDPAEWRRLLGILCCMKYDMLDEGRNVIRMGHGFDLTITRPADVRFNCQMDVRFDIIAGDVRLFGSGAVESVTDYIKVERDGMELRLPITEEDNEAIASMKGSERFDTNAYLRGKKIPDYALKN